MALVSKCFFPKVPHLKKKIFFWGGGGGGGAGEVAGEEGLV